MHQNKTPEKMSDSRGMSKAQLNALIYCKYVDIIAIISLIGLCVFLIKGNFIKSFIITNASYELPQNDNYRCASLGKIMKTILNCEDGELRQENIQYGEYWLMKNYIRGLKSINIGCGESVTYTANGDYRFMDNLPTVVERFLGPVSFALYAPGNDYNATMNSIQYVRNCLPQSKLIRDYVTFHIFFPQQHMPLSVARSEKEALDWKYNCELGQVPYLNVNESQMYRYAKNLTYPINVARNIARKNVNTYFVFACDVELYPSLGLIPQFLNMVLRNPKAILKGNKPKVFVLPVFEIVETASLPNNKEELQLMLNKSLAVEFHKYICSLCHLVPKQEQWIEADNSHELTVFTVGKRIESHIAWEPFYISDNTEPIFDERVTWEGRSDKRIQNYAMCLLDYEYHVLHPAFLVHAPGIKVHDVESEKFKRRLQFALAMNETIHTEIIPEYKVLFGNNENCGL